MWPVLQAFGDVRLYPRSHDLCTCYNRSTPESWRAHSWDHPSGAGCRRFRGVPVSDTTSTDQPTVYHGDAEPPPQLPSRRRRWPKRVGIAALAMAALFVGVGIGAGANSHAGALNSAKSANVSLRGQVSTLHSQAATMQGQLAAAQAQASNAVAAATSAANAKP